MAKTTLPEAYPVIYNQIALAVGEQGQTWRVPATGPMLPETHTATGETIDGWKLLMRLKGHFNAYKLALKRAHIAGNAQWEDTFQAAFKVSIYMKLDECAIYFMPKDDTWHAKALRSGMAVVQASGDLKPVAGPQDQRISPQGPQGMNPVNESGPLGISGSISKVLSRIAADADEPTELEKRMGSDK